MNSNGADNDILAYFENKQVLSIDDSATIRKYLKNILTPYGIAFDEAGSGEEGLNLYKERGVYDLLIVDLQLPDINGVELMQKIREFDDEVTIVMLTGQGDIRSASAAVRAGADGYIEKHHLPRMDDHTDLFYALEQAHQHRSGIIAHRQLQELKSDFYSMVTHDLRSPAGAITMALGVLQDGTLGDLNDQQARFVTMAERSSNQLLGLINDYLDFAKIDAGFLKINKEDTQLHAVVSDVVDGAQLHAQAKHQTLSVIVPDSPVTAQADGKKLRQVVENLVSNAIKYTPENGEIKVSLTAVGSEATIAVEDNGQGIPDGQINSMFAKYHRVPGKSEQKIQGTGLGLAIVKEIVEAHGGKVAAVSPGLGKGTTFTVRIPLA